MKSPLLSVCYSTLGSRGIADIEGIDALLSRDWIEVLVIWQRPDEDMCVAMEQRGARVVRADHTGLARSRNAAIEESRGRFIWFQDDDTRIVINRIDTLGQFLERNEAACVTVRIGCLENPDNTYKRYNRWIPTSQMRATRVSSIEMIIDREFTVGHGLTFDERLGLGAEMPLGEEAVFVTNLLRLGGRLEEYPRVPVLHTCLADGRRVEGEPHFVARGYVLASMRSPWRQLTALRWLLRGHPNLGRLRIARCLARGTTAYEMRR